MTVPFQVGVMQLTMEPVSKMLETSKSAGSLRI